MSKKKIMIIRPFTLLLLLVSLTSYAQQTSSPQEIIATLKSNPDIIWMGETITDYTPKYSAKQINSSEKTLLNTLGLKEINRVKILKLQLENLDEINNNAHDLSVKVLSATNEMNCYKDAELTEKHSVESLTEVDTIITFDPNTYEEVVNVVVNEINPDDVYTFRLKQLIYYDKSVKTFKTVPLAVAPILTKTKRDGSVISSKPLFWFSPKNSELATDLNNEGVDYAKRIYCRVDEVDIKIIKGKASMGEVLMTMIADIKKTPSVHYVAYSFDKDGNEQIDEKEVAKLGRSVDTIITFDSNFEEIVNVVVNEVVPTDLDKIRLIQDWVWNKDKKELEINFVGFAPLVEKIDYNGNYLEISPWFIRRSDKDK